MITSFDNATLPATPAMNTGGGIVNGTVSALVEIFVHERAPSHCPRSASLSRRLPPRRLHRVRACVETAQLRIGQCRRGSTSEIPDRLPLGSALSSRALVAAVRSHSVRPNYALHRTGLPAAFQLQPHRAAGERER